MSETSNPQKLLKTQREVISVGALSQVPDSVVNHYRRAETTHHMQR